MSPSVCPTVHLYCGTNFVLPSLDIVRVPRHTPRGPASPPCSRSPPQDGTKSQHDWNVSIICCPCHSCPDFVCNLLRQQRQASSSRSKVQLLETRGGPCQAWHQIFLKNTKRRIFHASVAQHSPLKRSSNQQATSYTVSVERHRSISVTRPFDFFRTIFPCASRTLSTAVVTGHATRRSPLLLCPRTLSACKSRLSSVVVATFAVGSNLLGSLVSIFTGAAVDPELRDHMSVAHLPSG